MNIEVRFENNQYCLYQDNKIYTNYIYIGGGYCESSAYPKLHRFVFDKKELAEKVARQINSNRMYRWIGNEFYVFDRRFCANHFDFDWKDDLKAQIETDSFFIDCRKYE